MFHTDINIVHLRQVEQEQLERTFTLDDTFFGSLPQEEILGGKVEVKLQVRFGSADTFTFTYEINGTIAVSCDRCLEAVHLPVSLSDSIKVAYGDDAQTHSDITVIPYTQSTYDIAWDMYELILLELPLRRIHPQGACNADMLARFSSEDTLDESPELDA